MLSCAVHVSLGRMQSLAIGALLLAILQAAPLAAQTKGDASAGSGDIVVLGRDKRERDQQVREFVRGMTPAPGTESIPRFDLEKLCPQAVGLGLPYDKTVTDRLRRVAAAARIDLAPEGCRFPNALLVFADDKIGVMGFLRQTYPWLFRDLHGDPITPEREQGPVVAWHVDGLVTRDGVPLPPGRGGPRRLQTTMWASRLKTTVRPVILMSVVVIEKRAIEGLTTTQLADYAAMRAFTDASPERALKSGAPTILTVIEAPMGSETAVSLTQWDLAFLRGLYAAPSNAFSGAQRGAIGSYMKRELDKPPEEKK